MDYICYRCGKNNPPWLAFETDSFKRRGPKYWCLHHLPLLARIRLWIG